MKKIILICSLLLTSLILFSCDNKKKPFYFSGIEGYEERLLTTEGFHTNVVYQDSPRMFRWYFIDTKYNEDILGYVSNIVNFQFRFGFYRSILYNSEHLSNHFSPYVDFYTRENMRVTTINGISEVEHFSGSKSSMKIDKIEQMFYLENCSFFSSYFLKIGGDRIKNKSYISGCINKQNEKITIESLNNTLDMASNIRLSKLEDTLKISKEPLNIINAKFVGCRITDFKTYDNINISAEIQGVPNYSFDIGIVFNVKVNGETYSHCEKMIFDPSSEYSKYSCSQFHETEINSEIIKMTCVECGYSFYDINKKE